MQIMPVKAAYSTLFLCFMHKTYSDVWGELDADAEDMLRVNNKSLFINLQFILHNTMVYGMSLWRCLTYLFPQKFR